MISLPHPARVFLHTQATDLREGFDGLSGLVITAFAQEPTSGHLFLFVNRRRDRLKILYGDRDGLAIWYKRLETGSFQLPVVTREAVSIDTTDCRESASSTTCPRPTRSARTAGRPRHASARMRRGCWSSSRPALNFRSTSCPSTPARAAAMAPATPVRPLSGCIAGAGVLADVVVSKFAEHLPLYRFEDFSTRYGLYLPRSTLCDWVRNVADLLKPLHELQRDLVRTAPVIWADDPPVTVLGGEGPGSHTGRFRVYIGPTTSPDDVYDFTENRTRDGPARFLANYVGYLHADAFSGYDGIFTRSDGPIIDAACWAHARGSSSRRDRRSPRSPR